MSIDVDDFERISKGPCASCGSRLYPRASGGLDDGEVTLDLDKSWRYFASVLHSSGPRPAEALVAGEVIHTSTGWISHQGAISPHDVAQIASDLSTVSIEDFRQHILGKSFRSTASCDEAEMDFNYVSSFLPKAQEFTARVAADGRAIVYYIG